MNYFLSVMDNYSYFLDSEMTIEKVFLVMNVLVKRIVNLLESYCHRRYFNLIRPPVIPKIWRTANALDEVRM